MIAIWLERWSVLRDAYCAIRYTRMKDRISSVERKILAVLQDGLPKSQSPYEDTARQTGIATEELLAVLRKWRRQGKLRRIGAIANHFKVGLGAGAMVVWQVEPERIEEVSRILAGFEEVSHVYERHIGKNWPYNIYSMVHEAGQEKLQQAIEMMAKTVGVSKYRVLETRKELKKVGPTYIQDS